MPLGGCVWASAELFGDAGKDFETHLNRFGCRYPSSWAPLRLTLNTKGDYSMVGGRTVLGRTRDADFVEPRSIAMCGELEVRWTIEISGRIDNLKAILRDYRR